MFWTYCINEPAVADQDFPIPMSYLDVILQGSLEVRAAVRSGDGLTVSLEKCVALMLKAPRPPAPLGL